MKRSGFGFGVAVLLWGALAGGCAERVDDPDGGVVSAFGQPCARGEDCESGLCVAIATGRAVCTRPCSSERDCPGSDTWGCVRPDDYPQRVCGCVPRGTSELCGNGRDDECNGEVDDCRTCGGRQVAADDPANCGACGVVCRTGQRCVAGECRCPPGSTECGGACVDVQTSVAHCGSCGRACGAGQVCTGGQCACPVGAVMCGSTCVSLQTSDSNCGACGNACAPGASCVGGRCTCGPAGQTYCAVGGCRQTSSDPEHCGGCDTVCRAGETCESGRCVCPGLVCNDVCVAEGDTANCRACGVRCAPGEICGLNGCQCPFSGALVCNGACVDPSSSLDHCGGCGNACPDRVGQFCSAGRCLCRNGGSVCADGICHDLRSDPSNCGACGVVCTSGQTCSAGRCQCPFATPTFCASTSQCVATSTDPLNCGACGVQCPSSQSCISGRCQCPFTAPTYCASTSTCVASSTDPLNCGACGARCPMNQPCVSGRCQCPMATPTYCASTAQCIATSSDPLNCGSCGNVCPSGTRCAGGSCLCATTSERYCASASACVNVVTSNAHCGVCDRACPSGASCSGGACLCSGAGLSACTTGCTDVQTDSANCGVCGNACPGRLTCNAGRCACAPPVLGAEQRLTMALGDSDSVEALKIPSGWALAFVDAQGSTVRDVWLVLLDESGVPTAPARNLTMYPAGTNATAAVAMAWTGTELGVAWIRTRSGSTELQLARFDGTGTVIAAPVSGGVVDAGSRIDLAWTSGAGYAVIWDDSSYVTLRLLGATATTPMLPVRVVTEYSSGSRVSLAANASGAFGILRMADPYVPPRFFRVNPDGSVTLPPIALTGSIGDLAFDGNTWVAVLGSTSGTVTVLRGETLGSTRSIPVPAGNYVFGTRIVSSPSRETIVTWIQSSQPQNTMPGVLRSVRLDTPTNSTVAPAVLVDPATIVSSTSVRPLAPPSIAVGSSGGQYLVAWQDTRWGQIETYSRLLTSTVCP